MTAGTPAGNAASVPLEALRTAEVENVYVYIADAVRYDELPEPVSARGLSFKMVAQALATPQCLPSIFSGLLPPKHGVLWFDDAIPSDLSTVFDIEAVATGYSELVWPGEALVETLGHPRDEDVTSIESPFVLVEHDNGGHAPYAGHEGERPRVLYEQLTSREELLGHYRETVAESVSRFEDRLALLEERGLLDETLVVFVADHGELLGEHGGFVGHGLPMAPEVVYVPAVFIHPSLPAGRTGNHLLQQVDIYPTVVDVLTDRSPDVDGTSLTEPVEGERPAFCQGSILPPKRFQETVLDPGYDARGVWTRDGGHVFVRNPRFVRAATAVFEATRSGYTAAFNSHRSTAATLGTTLDHYLRNYHEYGVPGLTRRAAEEFLDGLDLERRESDDRQISDETARQLEDLGYH